MRERSNSHKKVLALLAVGALVITLVGVFVGIVKRDMVIPMETPHVTHMNNSGPVLFEELRKTLALIIPETEQRGHKVVEQRSLHRVED
jgi:hypothetical protein